MKYRLINKTTNQETICDKVTIDGFEYYVSEEAKIKADNLWVVSKRTNYLGKTFYPKNDGTVTDDVIKNLLLSVKYEGHYETTVGSGGDCDLVIACTNPNIDIPQVVNEVERLANLYCKEMDRLAEFHDFNSFKYAYNKSQQTHPFSEQDMINFAEWRDKYLEELNQWKVDGSKGGEQFTTQELLNIWKEQNPKVIYYQ